jgi:hypothetical protein
MDHYKITKFQERVFDFALFSTYFLYILIALGLSANAPNYLSTLDYYVRIYVALFLILRFNPFRNVEFTKLDKKIAFSAGVFVLATTALNQILENFKMIIFNYFNSVNKVVTKVVNDPINNNI